MQRRCPRPGWLSRLVTARPWYPTTITSYPELELFVVCRGIWASVLAWCTVDFRGVGNRQTSSRALFQVMPPCVLEAGAVALVLLLLGLQLVLGRRHPCINTVGTVGVSSAPHSRSMVAVVFFKAGTVRRCRARRGVDAGCIFRPLKRVR